ncbi:MAG: YbhB/YbcL family Raf kinase inhibitor-like protein [Alphaproteobacteria bacterium]
MVSDSFSPDNEIFEGQVFNGFGCTGKNISPHVRWKNPPANAKTFAVTMFDPDAPTGSGWWHWILLDVPEDILDIGENRATYGTVYKNDYGVADYGGPCPPVGHGLHHYRLTVWALPQKLELPAESTAALVGYHLHATAIASATIVGTYGRK